MNRMPSRSVRERIWRGLRKTEQSCPSIFVSVRCSSQTGGLLVLTSPHVVQPCTPRSASGGYLNKGILSSRLLGRCTSGRKRRGRGTARGDSRMNRMPSRSVRERIWRGLRKTEQSCPSIFVSVRCSSQTGGLLVGCAARPWCTSPHVVQPCTPRSASGGYLNKGILSSRLLGRCTLGRKRRGRGTTRRDSRVNRMPSRSVRERIWRGLHKTEQSCPSIFVSVRCSSQTGGLLVGCAARPWCTFPHVVQPCTPRSASGGYLNKGILSSGLLGDAHRGGNVAAEELLVSGINRREVVEVIENQSTLGQVLRCAEAEACAKYPNSVVASLGIRQKREARTCTAGTSGKKVSKRTRKPDPERAPVAADLECLMREESLHSERTRAFTADVCEAH